MTDNIDDRDSPEKFNPVDGLPKPESSLMMFTVHNTMHSR